MLGSKPREFLVWVLALLGVRDGDEVHELFVASDGLNLLCAEIGLQYRGRTRWVPESEQETCGPARLEAGDV